MDNTLTYQRVLATARSRIGDYCKACTVCNGIACGFNVPGPGCKGPSNTAARNYDKWQEILLRTDNIDSAGQVDISCNVLGHQFKTPVFTAPIATLDDHYGLDFTDDEYTPTLLDASKEYGSLAFVGDSANPEIMRKSVSYISSIGGLGVPTVKPWYRQLLFEKLNMMKKVFACCMDIDGIGLPKYENGHRLSSAKSAEELREVVEYLDCPFIIKGIMTPRAAEKAASIGAKAIVVSNHGGRVQSGVPSTCEVLPEIYRAVKGQIEIFVDGGIRSGQDVFRALALGADAVLIGRPVLTAICGGGVAGYKLYMDKINAELVSTMASCSVHSIDEICSDHIYLPQK